MKQTKHILTNILAHLLVLAVVFPAVVQFTHIFENHEHTFCGDYKTHLHEQNLDCEFTKFISTVFHYESEYPELTITNTLLPTPCFNYSSIISKRQSQSNPLRGPPLFQQYC
mgnify:FL=1